MSNILKRVELADLVSVKAVQVRPGVFSVLFESLDVEKQVVFDEKALQVLNQKITEKCGEFSANHENTKPYIEEFVMRLANELYRSGLCVLEDIPEDSNDPYHKIKKQLK